MLRGDLAREGRVRGPGGSPPPLLPLVVYNGRQPWTAPVELGAGIVGLPTRLADIQPKFQYELLEVRRFDRDALALGCSGSDRYGTAPADGGMRWRRWRESAAGAGSGSLSEC